MDVKAQIEILRKQIAALEGGATDRLVEIQKEVNELLEEGMRLADAAGVKFSLSDSPIAANYGMGSLRYVPEQIGEHTAYNGIRTGWVSSSSDDC